LISGALKQLIETGRVSWKLTVRIEVARLSAGGASYCDECDISSMKRVMCKAHGFLRAAE